MTALRHLLAAVLLAATAGGAAAATPALPEDTLVEYRTPSGGDDLAVIFSGDGGWADLDRQLGQILAGRGISVLGFDCRKYFWQTRSPEETAQAVAEVLGSYLRDWGKRRLVLIGFSFGADMLPFVLNRLPADLKAKVALSVLLSPGRYANWEVHWGDWLKDQPHEGARQLAPEMAALSGYRLFCVYGADEAAGSICPGLTAGQADVKALPGGHHFDGNYANLAEMILKKVPPAHP